MMTTGGTDRVGTIVDALAEVLSCPVLVTSNVPEALAAFQEAHCLDPQIQPAFTAAALHEFVQGMPAQVVHEIEEPLGMAVTIARWDDRLLLIGPYTHGQMYPGTAEEVLSRLAIPTAYLSAYKLYRTRYAIVDAEYVHRSASAALRGAGRDDLVGSLQHVKAEGGTIAPSQADAPQSGSFAVIEERYRHEQDFMDAVADGATDRALAALHGLSGMPRISGYLNTPFLGATILRVMARVAAQRGGLPPVTIDAISQEYAQRLHRVGHTSDPHHALGFTSQLVTDFCDAVRRHRQRAYPPLVRRVTDEIDLHLSRQPSTADLAERLGVSTSTLARRFKDATGTTLSGYVAQRRAERAARLLATTAQSVRDIAMFVGYDDANYFVKVFRAEYGMTPTAYRDLHAR
ncbi:helix-turn-helix transcriptional regulator [Microbacterium ureisolvens]|uniref:Helix-turn-helix transcriptional regulator n=1 Tax=Microbacterium ureisolvens TaxID=2781186 RepID=A0ABS7I143_9MICO|nr:AraC family transcriptional regulator [Microbacterium ureisolvens]MBW9110339.1 helix-turn-helix transcriptional regulator [Microbacterium ureisolvens]